MQSTSPRRSSRARAVLLPVHTSHSSSTSSISSQRAERNTRSSLRHTSPSQKRDTPASVSSEDGSDTMRAQSDLPPRRSKRQHDHQEEAARAAEEADEEGAEDEGTIRCICGSQEYPGPATDGLPDAQIDFVMCDSCKVWQHGGCVGIFDESTNPDNYFCEECKPELHQLAKGYASQRYSHYLPVWEAQAAKSHRKSSIAKTTDTRSKDKERAARNAAAAADHAKRRSTMNSRANYDEEEVLRKVLEESKHDAPGTTDSSSRRGKRVREDSEDNKRTLKRQRTRSSSPSSPMVDSDSQAARDTPSGRQSQPRKLPAKVDHSKTYRDLAATSKELEKIEGAGKRKKAAEKAALSGKTTDSNPTPPEKIEPEPAEKTPQAEPAAALNPPDTPSSATATNPTVKKGAVPKQSTAKRGGRTIRNSTRETETPTAIEHPSPSRKGRGATAVNKTKDGSSGHEGNGSGLDTSTIPSHPILNSFLGKRGRHASNHQPRDPSMLELRKKANAMAHYIRESEMELARWSEKGLAMAVSDIAAAPTAALGLDSSGMSKEAMKLAGELSTRLVKWETEFGKFSEKT